MTNDFFGRKRLFKMRAAESPLRAGALAPGKVAPGAKSRYAKKRAKV